MTVDRKKLSRSRRDRLFVGVCGGLAQFLQVDPLWIRVAFVLLVPAGGLGFLAYFILAVLLPPEDRLEARPDQNALAGVRELGQRCREVLHCLAAEIRGKPNSKNAP